VARKDDRRRVPVAGVIAAIGVWSEVATSDHGLILPFGCAAIHTKNSVTVASSLEA
jgi:hypothetical protein